MSSRAEGCGLWLSTKEKRSTQLPLQKSGKAKKSKQKFLLRASSKRSNGLDIRVSSSPLSPRSRKKLQNAKQTKINKYFRSETYSKDSRRGNILEGVSERAGCFEGKLLAKISVKRKQKENTSDTGKLIRCKNNGIIFINYNRLHPVSVSPHCFSAIPARQGPGRGVGEVGYSGQFLLGFLKPLASQKPYPLPHYSLSQSIPVTFGQMEFTLPLLVYVA